jgi:parallel beta-helix repeat protein
LAIFCSLIFVVNLDSVIGASIYPNFYYYSDGRKISLPVSKEILAVRFKQGITLQQQKTIVESEPNLALFSKRKEFSTFKITLLPLREGVTEENVIQTINSLNDIAEIEFAYPVFDFPDAEILLTDEFLVKFGPSVSEQEIKAFNSLHNVEIVRKPEVVDWYLLRVKDPRNLSVLKTANLYYENPITEFSVPNFLIRFALKSVIPDDTYFGEQWALNNTGQSGGTQDADMDAPEGWQITTGSHEITIAIIDLGVDLTHEDLITNLVDGKDTLADDNDPSPLPYDAHGTACAGLAAAETNNGKGVAGVAGGCKIMPIRAGAEGFIDGDAAAVGIEWAAKHGADVLSNSWAGGESYTPITQAIIYAKNYGRGGKGCVIVCGSGNEGASVSYPARLQEVIAVGATDHNDVRWNYSNYGSELDVVAPSGRMSVLPRVSLWTTDISGVAGHNPGSTLLGDAAGDYFKWFSGTSGATPQVAGLAGLILSLNPELTSNEVQSIIQDTADEKGAPPYPNDYYGYGRVNIYNALLEAIPSKGHIDLDREFYNCNCNVGIFLADSHLAGQGTQHVHITTSGGDSETVILNEITPAVGVYRGTISTASGDPNTEDGILQVSDGETITGIYEDADDGTGNPALANDTAIADCVGPVIFNLDFNESPIGPDITVSFETNELTFARVLYGLNCGGPYNATALSYGFNHTVELKEAFPSTNNYFVVEATDLVGNETVDSNGSNCYRFTTDGPREINVPGDFNTIQEAIDQPIWDGSTVTVATGTYYETINFKGKAITVHSSDPNDWAVVEATVIYADGENQAVMFESGEDASSVLEGFTVKNSGFTGIYCNSSSSSIISKCIIAYNAVLGIGCEPSASATIINNIIRENGIHGIYYDSSSPVIRNNLIYNNGDYGISNEGTGSPGVVYNNTIVGHEYGIMVYGTSPTICNCILWDNNTSDLVGCSATYSCIEHVEEAGGEGNNITDNPCFVDPVANDYHLQGDSPCINAGDPDYEPEEGETDIDGDRRKMGLQVDMGADEADCLIGGVAHANEHADWVAWGKPDCWCYARECRGDINGLKTGPYWVQLLDLQLLNTAYNKTDSQLAAIPGGICADVNHKKNLGFRVQLLDLQELTM